MVGNELGDAILRSYRENERLRDAAPDLLDALRCCAEAPMSGWTIAQGMARAAIAKATGQ